MQYSPGDSGVQQRKLFERWHAVAYRGCKKATPFQVVSRWEEFLAMAKKCECGTWHLEFGADCLKCERRKKREAQNAAKVSDEKLS